MVLPDGEGIVDDDDFVSLIHTVKSGACTCDTKPADIPVATVNRFFLVTAMTGNRIVLQWIGDPLIPLPTSPSPFVFV